MYIVILSEMKDLPLEDASLAFSMAATIRQ